MAPRVDGARSQLTSLRERSSTVEARSPAAKTIPEPCFDRSSASRLSSAWWSHTRVAPPGPQVAAVPSSSSDQTKAHACGRRERCVCEYDRLTAFSLSLIETSTQGVQRVLTTRPPRCDASLMAPSRALLSWRRRSWRDTYLERQNNPQNGEHAAQQSCSDASLTSHAPVGGGRGRSSPVGCRLP